MFGYIYLVRNKVNGKRYIGQKQSSVFVEDYFGSGTYIKSAISKYGKENFEHEKILQECNSKEELNEAERYWIAYYNAVGSDDFYNLSVGGEGSQKGSKKSEGFKIKVAEKTANRVWKDESRKKISDYVSGRIWVYKENTSKQILPEELEIYISQGYQRGRPRVSSIARERMSESHRGKHHKVSKNSNPSGELNHFYGKHHSKEQCEKWSEVRKNMVWVYKDGKNTVINKDSLPKYLADGWTRGMIRQKR